MRFGELIFATATLPRASRQEVRVPLETTGLDAILSIPPRPRGMVIIAHGSGSGCQSPRVQLFARALYEAGLATLSLDLLTPEEIQAGNTEAGLDTLADRIICATWWLATSPGVPHMHLGYLGANSGGAAARIAAAKMGGAVSALVCLGGWTGSSPELPPVEAPALMIAGQGDGQEREMPDGPETKGGNEVRLVLPGVTHLLEEAQSLKQAARLSADWFSRHLGGASTDRATAGKMSIAANLSPAATSLKAAS